MNRILYASDCLDVLLDKDALPDESVDLIYLDPPFNSNSKYNLPFKGKYKSVNPVEAFDDTWTWRDQDAERLTELDSDPRTRSLADIVRFAQKVDHVGGGASLASYLLNMAVRLFGMRRVLKRTGSIYLHCDPTASHYLKLVMDAIFGKRNFRNEIIWCYTGPSAAKADFPRKHDVILRYVQSQSWVFNADRIRRPFKAEFTPARGLHGQKVASPDHEERHEKGTIPTDWWADGFLTNISAWKSERLGYPTQKPLALIDRILKASCPLDGVVLDPFCGCGTTLHAAEALNLNWIGIDISSFATGLVRDRLVRAFDQVTKENVQMLGNIPKDVHSARALAQDNGFEFEKWVCGHIGAEGMYKNPGAPGADGGVDGVMKFFPVRPDKKWKAEYAIVQVKGGHVTPDAVRALRETVDRFDVTAGVMVCFDQYMSTVENQRSRETFSDALGTYPVIQGYSVENLLVDAPLDLPLYGFRRQGALLSA